MTRSRSVLMLLVPMVALLAFPAAAQPFNSYLALNSGHTYVAIPPAGFDFTTGFTFEGWIAVSDDNPTTNTGTGCSSIAGKGYTQAWWIGVCGTTLRSYIKGAGSNFDGGTLGRGEWHHVAVTYDGTVRKHYIDGEEVASHAETGPMTSSTAEVRIGSDVNWAFTAHGSYDEVRFWNVARTKAQLRESINKPLTSGGALSVYHFDANANDPFGNRNGAIVGSGGFLAPPAIASCGSGSTTALCLEGKYLVSTRWVDFSGNRGNGTVVPGASANSGLFWFFSPDNWEVLVKELNGCGVNNRHWVFAAATTNVHYELIVTYVLNGETKRYFNYLNENAPAVTDTGAFATCP
ncbi:MAG: LamG domain-containing protein [Acidobacteria bacterium]|nr:LamG domain-containing protein [Acidobacteriota bacterium]